MQHLEALPMKLLPLIIALFVSVLTACAQTTDKSGVPPTPDMTQQRTGQTVDTATLAGGCFWCIEAVYQRLDGVTKVVSGYSGGSAKDADYKTVSTGTTQHAEVCQITFDPRIVTYDEILQVFFMAHDPTTLNRQGNDVGPQYRSAIFTHSDEQEAIAKAYIDQLTTAAVWPDPIVTEVVPYTSFFPAEDYHQNYYNENGSQPYCAFVVRPKVEKFMKSFKGKLKEEYKHEQ
jgi:peptide-methionine (S)-S-oxide reductase